jgi:hypothetical protein
MDVNSINNQNDYAVRALESREQAKQDQSQVNTQQALQQEVLQETTTGAQSPQKQMMALLASVQPEKQVQQTAQDQLQKGFLDVRI